MAVERGFLDDIRAHPEDDTPRLVYADWLDEQGQTARAEFIRVQIDLARLDPTNTRYPELHLRQLQLLSEHEREWLGPWTDRLVRWQFQRGLLHEVTVEPEPFVAFGADLLTHYPVHTVAFVDGWGQSLAPEAIQRVVGVPHLALVRGLELSGCRPGENSYAMFGGTVQTSAWLTALAGATHATHLEALSLPGGTRSGRGPLELSAMRAFCGARHLASLRRLDLSDAYMNEGPDRLPELCAILADATFAPRLRRLSLAHCTLTDAALAHLAGSARLRYLEAVDFSRCDAAGAEGLRAFLASRPPDRLIELGFPNGLDLRELGAWPGLEGVKALSLAGMISRSGESSIHYPDGRVVRWTAGRDVGEGEWVDLFRSPHFHPIRLAIWAEAIPDDALAVLFHQDWLRELQALDLGDPSSGWRYRTDVFALLLDRDLPQLHEFRLPRAADLPRNRLAEWPVLPRLTQFSFPRRGNFAAWLLSRGPLTAGVARLDLEGHEGGVALARALAESPWTQGIRHLDFGYNGLTSKVIARLAAAPFAPYLEALHLGSEHDRNTLAALRALSDDRIFPRLRDVVVGSNTVEGGIEVLRRRFGSRLRVWADC
jgi:uncharacterized protein (TIGR02996 family)